VGKRQRCRRRGLFLVRCWQLAAVVGAFCFCAVLTWWWRRWRRQAGSGAAIALAEKTGDELRSGGTSGDALYKSALPISGSAGSSAGGKQHAKGSSVPEGSSSSRRPGLKSSYFLRLFMGRWRWRWLGHVAGFARPRSPPLLYSFHRPPPHFLCMGAT
jgi:hypothetical protein